MYYFGWYFCDTPRVLHSVLDFFSASSILNDLHSYIAYLVAPENFCNRMRISTYTDGQTYRQNLRCTDHVRLAAIIIKV